MTFLYDQFNKLSEEFSKCIGDRGEFSGNFKHFHRRHQAISHSVQERERERKIYSHNAGNQKGFSPSKLVPIANNLTKNMLEQITQNVQT